MYRAEIIANRSVQDELIDSLEKGLEGFLYTLIPEVQGKGYQDKKMGNTVWPELNFLLIAYIKEGDAPALRKILGEVRSLYPREGIRLFMVRSED
jgi:hypothetical protein